MVATGISPSGIRLTWTDVSGESGYRIKRWNGGPSLSWDIVGTLGPNVTTYTDTELASKSGYSYLVCAHNSAGETCSIDYVSAETLGSKPSAPGNLQATGVSTTQVRLSWTDSTGETGYRVSRLEGDRWVVAGTPVSDATSFADTRRPEGAGYWYEVCAVNGAGETCAAGFVWGETLKNSKTPTAPDPRPCGVTSTEVGLCWPDTDGESGYRVERMGDSTWVVAGTLAADATAFTDGDLSPATRYTYRICAFNDAGEACSGPLVISTQPEVPTLPCPAAGLISPPDGAVLTSHEVALDWEAVTGCTFGRYILRVRTTPDMDALVVSTVEEFFQPGTTDLVGTDRRP